MARKTREESENTKALILRSALDCFYEKGFSCTTFEDIAARINLTKGAVYWHFKNKGELLADMIRHWAEMKHRENDEQRPEGLSELRDFFRREAEYMEQNPDVQKFVFFTLFQIEWSDSICNEVEKKAGKLHDFHFKIVKHALTTAKKNGEIAAETDIRALCVIIVGLWRGLLNTYICKEAKFNLSQTFLEGFNRVMEKNQNLKG